MKNNAVQSFNSPYRGTVVLEDLSNRNSRRGWRYRRVLVWLGAVVGLGIYVFNNSELCTLVGFLVYFCCAWVILGNRIKEN